jgi:MFS family permease
MTPAALSILTTSFNVGTDRVKALGAWGAMGGFSGVLGVFLGGVISAGPGWRWVLYINVPICAVVIIAAYLLVSGEAPRRQDWRASTRRARCWAPAGCCCSSTCWSRHPTTGGAQARRSASSRARPCCWPPW